MLTHLCDVFQGRFREVLQVDSPWSEEIEKAEKRGYSRGYQAKRAEGVDHKTCLATQASLENVIRDRDAEITYLKGQIEGMVAFQTLTREQR